MMVNTSAWLFYCLKMLFKRPPRPHASNLSTLVLPPEIILIITSHLDPASAISFSLTCRYFHSLCFPLNPRLEAADKERLLLWLEKEVPNLYFCYACVTLHSWRKRLSASNHPFSERSTCPDQERSSHHGRVFLATGCIVPYHQIRLIMNRHFYGPAHGPPLEIFRRSDVARWWDGGWLSDFFGPRFDRSETLDARIIDDKLLTRATTTYRNIRGGGGARGLRMHIDKSGETICRHIALRNCAPYLCPVQLPELVEPGLDEENPVFFTPCEGSFRSCPWCMTDYRIDIECVDGGVGYRIRVAVWRELGDGRSPFAWCWRNVLGDELLRGGRVDHPEGYGPGSVRDKWLALDGVCVEDPGSWVDVPLMAECQMVYSSPGERW